VNSNPPHLKSRKETREVLAVRAAKRAMKQREEFADALAEGPQAEYWKSCSHRRIDIAVQRLLKKVVNNAFAPASDRLSASKDVDTFVAVRILKYSGERNIKTLLRTVKSLQRSTGIICRQLAAEVDSIIKKRIATRRPTTDETPIVDELAGIEGPSTGVAVMYFVEHPARSGPQVCLIEETSPEGSTYRDALIVLPANAPVSATHSDNLHLGFLRVLKKDYQPTLKVLKRTAVFELLRSVSWNQHPFVVNVKDQLWRPIILKQSYSSEQSTSHWFILRNWKAWNNPLARIPWEKRARQGIAEKMIRFKGPNTRRATEAIKKTKKWLKLE